MAKTKTLDQIIAMKDKAVRFLRDVAGDSPRADEVEDESPESYAERKRIVIDNPRRGLTAQQKGGVIMAKRLTRDDLADQVAELEEQNCPPVADSRSRLAIYGGGTATRRDYLRHFAYVDSLRRADF